MQFNGVNQLVGALKKRANLNDVKNVVKLNGSEMQRNTQRKAPVDTGNLKRLIVYRSEDGGFTARVRSEAEYAPYPEYGTRFMAAIPHIRPAYHEQKRKFINDMKRLMK